jgi:serine phosphatase RsbU (regulator of sigma subunit)
LNREFTGKMSAIKQIVKSVTAIVGLTLLVYMLVYFAAESTKVARWRHSGSVSTAVNSPRDSLLIFARVDVKDFVGPAPTTGDTLTGINDSLATKARMDANFESPVPPWTTVPIEYHHEGRTVQTTVMLRAPSYAIGSLIVVLQVIRFFIAFLFISVGLWAFFARPDSAGVRALAWFSFAMAAFIITAVQVIPDAFTSIAIPYGDNIRQGFNSFCSLFSAFWLNLIFLFPRPLRFHQNHKFWSYALCYAPVPLMLGVSALLQALGVKVPELGAVLLIVYCLQVFGGMIMLAIRYVRATDRLEKRQTRLVLYGTGVGLALLFALLFLSQALKSWFAADPTRQLVIINLSFLCLLLSPITFAYAFNRYRLLEVESRLRRGTRYLLTAGVLLGIIAAIALGLGVLLTKKLGASGGSVAVVVSIILAAGISPVLKQVRGYVERRVYPERQRLRLIFRNFLQQSYTLTDRRSFWSHLEDNLREGLMVEGVYPLLCGVDGGGFYYRDSERTPFELNSHLVERLERERRPIMVDEAVATARVRLSPSELAWLSERRIALVLPLMTHARLIGFLGLGVKTEQEDYGAEELQILDSLSSQVALASENIRLIEENLGKKRLEEELEMARKIQNGFLPREIPETPGLEVAAGSRFCLEVAGDYYDIIPLSNGETVLAVGDVSGKGAGAALLMANLQASLRTAIGVNIPLAEVVGRINDLIFRNTPPEQFITFFAAVYDPESHRLTYVNAGHNPPLVLREAGTIEALEEGGLVLGIVPGIVYQQATVVLESGDLLLMYTDGVSEAMNSEEEEYGELRMAECIESQRLQAARAALDFLESEVLAFHGDAPLEDDFTLLLARVV